MFHAHSSELDIKQLQNERLQGGSEIPASLRALMQYMGLPDYAGLISDEIGGGNGLQPTILSAEMGKPVLDGDLMGRAYPNVSRILMEIIRAISEV